MSKTIKAIKQVSAVAASTLLLSSSAFANLGNYGSNFVKDGKFSGQVVVGTMTGADDVAAANVVIADLKTKYASSEDTYTLTYSKSNSGSQSASLGKDLTYGTNLSSDETVFETEDLSFLRTDAIVKLEDATEVKFTETLLPSNTAGVSTFNFEWNSNLKDVGYTSSKPTPFIKLNSEPLYVLRAEFDSNFRFTDSSGKNTGSDLKEDSIRGQSLKLFGREFVFANKNTNSSDIKMYTAANTISLSTYDGKSSSTIEYDGKSYSIEVIEANENDQEAFFKVNGVTGYAKTDDAVEIAGLSIFVKKVFVGNTIQASGKKILSVELFVGGNEIIIPKEAVNKFVSLEVAGEDLEDYKIRIVNTNSALTVFDEIKTIEFAYVPQELSKDKIEYLTEGKTIQDPFFKEISFNFEGYSPKIGSGDNEVSFDVSSDKSTVKFIPVGSSNPVTLNVYSIKENTDASKNVLEYYKSSSETFKIYNKANATKALLYINALNALNLSGALAANAINTTYNGASDLAAEVDIHTLATNVKYLTATELAAALTVSTGVATSVQLSARKKLVNALNNEMAKANLLVEDDVFIIDEELSKLEDAETGIYKVISFEGLTSDSESSQKVTIKNLVTGSSKTYKKGDDLAYGDIKTLVASGSSSGTYNTAGSSTISTTAGKVSAIELSVDTISTLTSKGGLKIEIGVPAGTDAASAKASLTITEFSAQEDRDVLTSTSNNLLGTVEYGIKDEDETKVKFGLATQQPNQAAANYANLNVVTNDLSDVNTFITEAGTYVKADTDSDSTKVTMNVPNSQRIFSASFSIGKSTSSMSKTVTATNVAAEQVALEKKGYTVSKSAPIKASSVAFDVVSPTNDANASAKDNIVIGGPMVNSVAKTLLGKGIVGVSEGQAIVRYFKSSNSILVYGYSKAGTLAAAKKLTSGSAISNQKFNE